MPFSPLSGTTQTNGGSPAEGKAGSRRRAITLWWDRTHVHLLGTWWSCSLFRAALGEKYVICKSILQNPLMSPVKYIQSHVFTIPER